MNQNNKLLDRFIIFMLSILNKWNLKRIDKYDLAVANNKDNYEALIPNTQDKKKTFYNKPFLVALKTPNVNNIAITGAYGSGKSSFLRQFEKEYAEWNYLPVSLATFEDSKSGEESQTHEENEITTNFHQDIERSILQQFFYREKDSKIPFSRFKKIKKVSKIDIFLLTVSIPYLYLYIFRPKKVKMLLSEDIINFIQTYNSIFLGLALLLAFSGLYRLLYYFSSFQISKFDIKKNSITIARQDEASILNEHLDEILYFFEETKYDVVIFEDIDRFDNTEIFVKLRELNNLINNSKQVNRRVVFVYAIRDDMFIDKERTKFFDFIIPIIPYINPSNSEQILIDKFRKEIKDKRLDEHFLSQISWYIDDMRLLLNIYNEYMIYKNNLNSDKLDHNKLLALIVCKNFYPLDFAKLHVREGEIYKLFVNKPQYIKAQIKVYEQEKTELYKQIKAIENENIYSLEELKIIYLGRLFAETKADAITIPNTSYSKKTFNDLLNTNILDEIDSDTSCEIYNKYCYNYSNIGLNKTTQKNFGEIEDLIDEKNSYIERKELIKNKANNKIDKLKKEIENINKKINKLKSLSLKELFEIASKNILSDNYKDKDLLIFLVRNGYIDEYYEHYISYFHEGGITQDDREFLLSIQNHKPLDFTAQLGNIPKLLEKLDEKSFNSKYVLNNQLTSYLLNSKDTRKKEKYFETVSNGSYKSIEFIFQYVEYATDEEKSLFLKRLSWNGLWKYIDEHLSIREQNRYFKLLFNALEVDRLVELDVSSYLSKQTVLPKYTKDENEKCIELIDKLNILFRDIKNPSDNPLLFSHIYEQGHYVFSPKMIEIILQEKGKVESSKIDDLKYNNLTIIRESAAEKLIELIDKKINEYFEGVLNKIDDNKYESEQTLIYVLNHDQLDMEFKKNIIKKSENKIHNILEIKDRELWSEILYSNLIVANWDNVFNYYIEKKELDNVLFSFLDNFNNAKQLSKTKINKAYFEANEEFEKQGARRLLREILQKNEFNNNSYIELIKSHGYWYSDLELMSLSEEKINILIEKERLQPQVQGYDEILKKCKSCAIKFVEKYIEKYLNDEMEISLSSEIVLGLISSENITEEEKFQIIEKVDNSIFEESIDVKEVVSKLYVENSKQVNNKELFNALFYGENKYDLEFLLNQLEYFESCDDIKPYLEALKDEQYSQLLEKSASKHFMEDTTLNRELLKKLESKDCISSWRENKKKLGQNDLKVERKRV